jgi:hypothetical protein
MAAAPQFGTFLFKGVLSGRLYNVDAYFSDVNDTFVRFDGGAGASATSPDSWIPGEAVVLVDQSIVSGMTDTTKIQILRGNSPTGDFLRYTQHLTTSAFRSPLSIGFQPGIPVRVLQKT